MALDWEKEVYSDMISTVGYDQETSAMYVTFKKNGSRYVYKGVPEDLALQLIHAGSAGQFLNTEIKPYYGFSRG